MSEEKLPVSDALHIIKSKTVFKSEKWWLAVALVDSFGRKQVCVYLWLKRADGWKRKQKLTVTSRNTWEEIKQAVDEYLKDVMVKA